MSILSLNLAVLNVLPIPALDGGRLLEFAAISFVFSLAIQLQVCLVALERVDVNNIVLHAPEQYHVACGKVSPVADLKQRKQKAGSVVERRRKATLPAV